MTNKIAIVVVIGFLSMVNESHQMPQSTGTALTEEEFRESIFLNVDKGDGVKQQQAFESAGLFEGDIEGQESEGNVTGPTSNNAIKDEDRLWPDGIVPYTISDQFTKSERLIIARAMREIRDKSCVDFVILTTQTDYIKIVSGQGCHSNVGRFKGGQTVSLQRNQCMTVPTVIHELMHVLGFEHEHNRPDRDEYIRINTGNVDPEKYAANFKKYDESRYKILGSYDTISIMHYFADAFAIIPTVPVITPVSGNWPIGNKEGKLSPLDQQKLNKLYQCDSSLTVSMDCPSYIGTQDNPCNNIRSLGCYCTVKQSLRREDAETFCQTNHMQLVSIESRKEDEEIDKLMVENGVDKIWTGGRNPEMNGKWRWDGSPGTPSFPITFTNWCLPDEPDNFDGDEIFLVKKIGCWEDSGPHAMQAFICEPPLSNRVLLESLVRLQYRLDLFTTEINDLKKRNYVVSEELRELKEKETKTNTVGKAAAQTS